MKGITEIDEQAALLLVRAYKSAYQTEGPRIRSEVWTSIAQQLNKQNTRNLTVPQWKKRISNIKSLVKLKKDMERRGRNVNWTNIEREYLRLFPNQLILDDDNSSLSGGPNSTTNGFSLEEEQTLTDQDEMDETPATMVKTEAPKWNTEDFRRTLLEAHRQFLVATASTSSSQTNSSPITINEQSNSVEFSAPAQSITISASSESTHSQSLHHQLPQQTLSNQAPAVNIRQVVSQLDAEQRKKYMLLCLANFRQQIDLFTELLEQDLGGRSF